MTIVNTVAAGSVFSTRSAFLHYPPLYLRSFLKRNIGPVFWLRVTWKAETPDMLNDSPSQYCCRWLPACERQELMPEGKATKAGDFEHFRIAFYTPK